MTSLIEGWFLLKKQEEKIVTGTPPSSQKTYLTIFDSCPGLGPLSTKIYIDCEIRLFAGGVELNDRIIHAHGRFVTTTPSGKAPSLEMEAHRFDVMCADDTPDTLCTSVTIIGRVSSSEANPDVLDKFFTIDASDYVRDRMQAYKIRFGGSIFSRIPTDNPSRCRLNRSGGSKRWDKAIVPSLGTTVLVSGFLSGDGPQDLLVEVETMQFVSSARGAEGVGSSPGKSKFGVPTSCVFFIVKLRDNFVLTKLQQG